MKKTLLFLMLLGLCFGCSNDNKDISQPATAQEVYNDMKGTYTGSILVDNIPQTVTIVIANDFTVQQMPVKAILQRIFTDEAELTEAVKTASSTTFTAATEAMTIQMPMAYLKLKDTDFQFNVTVKEKTYQVTAMTKTTITKPLSDNTITVVMTVTELLCDNKTYDVSKQQLVFLIDMAQKKTSE